MRIADVLFAPGRSAFFFDDQRAIKAGAQSDGFVYEGGPATPGFTAVRQAGECVSILLVLEDGQVAVGDCAAVQYSGAGGRDPLFLADAFLPVLASQVKPLLAGVALDGFRPNADRIDGLRVDGRRLHTALRYGVTQALLGAQALADGVTMTEVVAREWDLPLVAERIPLFGQSGDDRYTAVDRMILKEVDALPHGLINNVEHKLGRRGEKLQEYIRWLAGRIERLRRRADYRPDLHIDVYGTLGLALGHDAQNLVDYLASLDGLAGGLRLYIEGPVDMGERERQIEVLAAIREGLDARTSGVRIVADEWCNTLEDIRLFADHRCAHMVQIKTPDLGGIQNVVDSVLYCNANGVESYQGGTCNETDLSARVCTHLAVAARPKRMLVKPGMGFDEGYTIVNNEMTRILALLEAAGHGSHEEA
jgi:methylaspartate ammonia-lyase